MAEAHKKTVKKKETVKAKAAPKRKKAAAPAHEKAAPSAAPEMVMPAAAKAAPPEAVKEEKAAPVEFKRSEKVFRAAPAKGLLPAGVKYYGTGRRKEAVAKVWLTSGKGKIVVNAKPYSEYFCNRKLLEFYVNRPLVATSNTDKFDVYAFVQGGGVPGQASAVSLGIARALLQVNPDLKTQLKREGLLTRDPRMKERKKYGLKRARRAFQFTKR